MTLRNKYPHEFLGRCATCLDNANLSSAPCRPVLGLNGSPVIADDCLVYRAQRAYDKERADGEQR